MIYQIEKPSLWQKIKWCFTNKCTKCGGKEKTVRNDFITIYDKYWPHEHCCGGVVQCTVCSHRRYFHIPS